MDAASRLAINGGPPAVTGGPFPWPPTDEAVRDALDAAWRDGDWGRYHGARCGQLRDALAEHHGVDHVHLCSSGTVAVEMALRSVGVAAGDGVVLAGYDFPGNFRAIEAIGAVPVLADVAPQTWSLDVAALEKAADAADALNVRAVVVSHLHGGLADMPRLRALAEARGWWVVEDACQAVGATLAGRAVGSWGDVGVLSFGGSKLLTAGRGGALLTNDEGVMQRLKVVAGRGNDAYPLSELQAAVLLPQLEKLAANHAKRLQAVERLLEGNAGVATTMIPLQPRNDASHAFYKLAWLAGCSTVEHVTTMDAVIAALQAEGAPIDRGFRGFVSRSRRRCQRLGPLEESTRCAEQTAVLHHPVLMANDETLKQVSIAIAKVATALLPA